MIKFILKIVIATAAVVGLAYLIPDITVTSIRVALIAGVIFALIHTLVRPLLRIITFPLKIVTLGIFPIILNMALFWLVSAVVPGFTIGGFLAVIIGSILFWAIMSIVDMVT